ncbi:MAG: hypothetical protein JXR73_08580 [Candidatus Omnitrophica bacterium]|nr:hypothetical protein [Candidatus Omnitrophota bacterium]
MTTSKFHKKLQIEIYRPVFTRMKKQVLSSDQEEGGIFIGRVQNHVDVCTLQILSYIDSGPMKDHSSAHLHPDRFYQYNVFRVLERFDPSIEHLGAWHSHHCNGSKMLSGPDIRGYHVVVNHPDYNPDWYFVLLVTGLREHQLNFRCFLFRRDSHLYIEIPRDHCRVVNQRHGLEGILLGLERLVNKKRSLKSK